MRLYEDQPSGTVTRARAPRRDASTPERRLLRALREAFPHLKWRHQAPVGPFYADILCLAERLVIEVDGDTHTGRELADARRTACFAREGYHMIRVANADVMQNLDGVLAHLSFSLRGKEGVRGAPPRGDEGEPETRKGDAR